MADLRIAVAFPQAAWSVLPAWWETARPVESFAMSASLARGRGVSLPPEERLLSRLLRIFGALLKTSLLLLANGTGRVFPCAGRAAPGVERIGEKRDCSLVRILHYNDGLRSQIP